jgi:uridylate kinase
LKLSGEVLGGSARKVLDFDFVQGILGQIKAVAERGIQVGIVVGGGNILRGSEAVKHGLGRTSADFIGMLGTMVNGIALRDVARNVGLDLRVMSCIPSPSLVEPYDVAKAVGYLESGKPVVFAGGTGNPFLTTDTAAAIRAAEIGADAVLKATKVDGVYSADPACDPKAKRLDRLTCEDAMAQNLGFMDRSALCLLSEAGIPIVVFNVFDKNSIERAASGERIGTIVAGVSHGG